MAQKNERLSTEHLADDELVTDLIRKAPLQIKLQLAALNHHLRFQKTKERILRERARDIMNKYAQKTIAVNGKANELIAGERVLNEEELQYAVRQLPREEAQKEKILPQKLDKIADYWIKVLINCERINREIFEVDYALLRKLKGLEYGPALENRYSFSIIFAFEENEFIHDEKLSIKCVMDDNGHQIIRIEATPPRWKEDKNFTKKVVQMKQQNKKTGEIRTVKKIASNDSFFNLFQSRRLKGSDDDEERIQRKMENIHDLAITIRDEVLIYHLEYYLGFRKSPNAHLPNIDYEEEEKRPEVVHRKSGGVGGVSGNKCSPNKKERSGSPGPIPNEKKERKSSGKKNSEEKKKEEKKGGCGQQ